MIPAVGLQASASATYSKPPHYIAKITLRIKRYKQGKGRNYFCSPAFPSYIVSVLPDNNSFCLRTEHRVSLLDVERFEERIKITERNIDAVLAQ